MVLSVLLVSLAVVGCRGAASEPPVEGAMLIGQGGGFTGLYSGYLLRSDGSVFRWSQMPGQAEQTEPVGQVPADSLQPFFRQLVEWERRKLNLAGAGNMTEFVELRHGEHRYRLQWGIGDSIPQEVREFTRIVYRFLRRHLP